VRISVAIPQFPHESRFVGELAHTAKDLGHWVTVSDEPRDDLHIQWGARPQRTEPTLYCELGWLPRWSYQVSHTGINGKHHRQGERLPGIGDAQVGKVHMMLQNVKRGIGAPKGWGYLDIDAPPAESVPHEFVLAPLQMEQDTNMASVPAKLQTNAEFINAATTHVAGTLGDVPIVFKQHPHSQARPQLGLKTWREGDKVYPHRQAHVYQYLKHTGCVAVIARNSNVLVDSLLWDVPAMSMGRGIWPDDLFLHSLGDMDLWPLGTRDREAFLWWLRDVQWSMSDARSLRRVSQVIDEVGG
jgi:hypothetical protein